MQFGVFFFGNPLALIEALALFVLLDVAGGNPAEFLVVLQPFAPLRDFKRRKPLVLGLFVAQHLTRARVVGVFLQRTHEVLETQRGKSPLGGTARQLDVRHGSLFANFPESPQPLVEKLLLLGREFLTNRFELVLRRAAFAAGVFVFILLVGRRGRFCLAFFLFLSESLQALLELFRIQDLQVIAIFQNRDVLGNQLVDLLLRQLNMAGHRLAWCAFRARFAVATTQFSCRFLHVLAESGRIQNLDLVAVPLDDAFGLHFRDHFRSQLNRVSSLLQQRHS